MPAAAVSSTSDRDSVCASTPAGRRNVVFGRVCGLSAQEGGSTVCTCLTEVLVRGDAADKGHNAEKEQRCDTDVHFG